MSDRSSFDLQPTLVGVTLLVRPLESADFEPLFAAASDPLIWEQHPEFTRYQRPVFEQFFSSGIASRGAFAVIDRVSGAMIGSSRYYDWDSEKREIAIGFTFLIRSHWGGATNHELKALMLNHAAQWADRVWFHIGESNIRSQKSVEKLGARFSHFGEKHLNGNHIRFGCYQLTLTRPALLPSERA